MFFHILTILFYGMCNVKCLGSSVLRKYQPDYSSISRSDHVAFLLTNKDVLTAILCY